jgi:hypothetical protein
VWLRFYDDAGNLVPLPEEAAGQQGLQQGLQQGAMRQLLRLLTARFGTVPPDVELLLQALDVNQLGDLVEVAISVDSLEQFVNHLS